MQNNHLIIMAGGIGSRFWPMSTIEKPKQFLDILGIGKSLLQLTVERFKNICPSENVWIVTSERYRNLTLEQLPQLEPDQVLLEPCMRNTAPCIAYAAWKIRSRAPNANLVISPADHIVIDTTEFQRVINESLEFTASTDNIVTLGITPTRPETGYGYIQRSKVDNTKNQKVISLHTVAAFREKPDMATAKRYFADGNYFWNAGIFIWKSSTLEKAFRLHLPDIAKLFDKGNKYWFTTEEQLFINKQFPNCEKISVDYGIMERAQNIYVYPADFGWSDLGTWGSLCDQLPKKEGTNAVIGEQVKMINSEECIVCVPKDKKVVVQGLNNYIIAENDNNLLICKKKHEQKIKEYSKLFE